MSLHPRVEHDPPAPAPVEVLLGLGSNLGDRDAALLRAVERLRATPGIEVLDVSPFHESVPVGGPPQPTYRNGAARLRTTLPPHALLGVCKAIEREAGRVPGPRNGPRPLDLDILTYGDVQLETRDLVIPHPRLHERPFVLDPLRALGADVDAIPRGESPRVATTPLDVQARTLEWRQGSCTIGFVPTMGALHEGHASLIRRARRECDRVVVSIFVNPLQFAAHEDLDKYPRPLSADLELCRQHGVDLVFVPGVADMYPAGFASRIAVGAEAETMEGASRPGHFVGVATVVARLWSIVLPDRSYYGRKDAQQVAVLRRLHQDLCLSGELVECPIDREEDGLARSSRNVYLGPADRVAARAVPRALAAALDAHRFGETRRDELLAAARRVLEAERRCVGLDYLEIRRDVDLAPWPAVEPVGIEARILVAARFGQPPTRRLDNAAFGESLAVAT
ncbi:MAG: pantoate--beta-alanine ligase [Planctomycetota bacterium]